MKRKKNVSRSVKSREWHMKKMIDGMEQVIKHAEEILVHDTKTMQDLKVIYLVICQQHLLELERMNGKKRVRETEVPLTDWSSQG